MIEQMRSTGTVRLAAAMGAAAVLLLLAALTIASSNTRSVPLPRIAARSGFPQAELYNTSTGGRFYPGGFTYTLLDKAPGQAGFSNVTFDPGFYDANAADAALVAIHDEGFNVVRVILDSGDISHQGRGQYGIAGPRDSEHLYEPFLDNFLDFLRRAHDHGVYVIASVYAIPQNRGFKSVMQAGHLPGVSGTNGYYLTPGGIQAKSLYLNELVGDVRRAYEGSLLSTVLAWEIQVELFLTDDSEPFSTHEGTVQTADGGRYDMANIESRQACMDSNLVNWAARVSAAVRAEDPAALTTVGLFTYNAVHKRGPNGLIRSPQGDPRYPARVPPFEDRRTLSFVDIHAYTKSDPAYKLAQDLGSLEFAKWNLSTLPFLLGEFGANRRFFPTLQSASAVVRRQQQEALNLGFAGTLFWTWNTRPEVPNEWWNAVESNGGILRTLQRPR
jgi:hypothetical protein